MTASLTALSPRDVAARLAQRSAILIDVREPDEFAREHVAGSISAPLSAFDHAHLGAGSEAVIFTCRSGARTGANCDRLAARVEGGAFVMEGGIGAWKAAGLPVTEDRKAPLEMMRQVQIGAGGLTLLGVVLSVMAHPGFIALSGFVGAGLLVAGLTGFCGLAKVLALMPWNRPRAAA